MFSKELRKDLLITALEGGSNYWYLIDTDEIKKKDYLVSSLSEKVFQYLLEGNVLPIKDIVNGEIIGSLQYSQFDKLEEALQENNIQIFDEIMLDNWDANSADVWFQFMILGELIYG